MKRTIAALLVTSAASTALVLSSPGSASALHCTDNGGPGNSDFADHVQSASHKEGVTHKGWASCIPGNPNFTG